MLTRIFKIMIAGFLLAAAGCATTPGPDGSLPIPSPSDRIAELDRALESETDTEKIPALLFERGHAYFEKAEQLREATRGSKNQKADVEYSTLILYVLRDFEAVVKEFPASEAAPEALYHLGVVYDYPNLSSFGPALRYYRQTVEEYPDTEAALRARRAIKKIVDNVQQVREGNHRKGI